MYSISSSERKKKVMIVNTASKCGLTQYKELERLQEVQDDDNFVVVGFPANNLGSRARNQ
jgi:glutathione peroxidase